jgi:ABC-2 type transport system ATP-binding protein
LRLDGVGKRYGLRMPWVVRDVSLEIKPGGLVRLEGRNGTGKSTLLRVIAGVSVPTEGAVSGRPVTGFVPERFPPALPFPARDYLMHIGRVHGLADAELATRIQVCLDRLGGWELVDVPLRNMSKGMCQKVAVAQALLPGSGLLVLDEAWTGLDVEAKAALDDVVAERLSDGNSVVFVDHDPHRLESLDAERWRIEEGRARPVPNPAPGQDGESGEDSRDAAVRAQADDAQAPAEAGTGGMGTGGTGTAGAVAGDVVIEVEGYPPDAADPASLPGVQSAVRNGKRLTVGAEAQASDSVLRVLLGAGDGVHVVGVQGSRESGAWQ